VLIDNPLPMSDDMPPLIEHLQSAELARRQKVAVALSRRLLPEPRRIVEPLENAPRPWELRSVRELLKEGFVQPLKGPDQARELVLKKLPHCVAGHIGVHFRGEGIPHLSKRPNRLSDRFQRVVEARCG